MTLSSSDLGLLLNRRELVVLSLSGGRMFNTLLRDLVVACVQAALCYPLAVVQEQTQ